MLPSAGATRQKEHSAGMAQNCSTTQEEHKQAHQSVKIWVSLQPAQQWEAQKKILRHQNAPPGSIHQYPGVTVKLAETWQTCMTMIDYRRLCTKAEQRFTQAILRIRGARRGRRIVRFKSIGGLFLTRLGSSPLAAWECGNLKRKSNQGRGTGEVGERTPSENKQRGAHAPCSYTKMNQEPRDFADMEKREICRLATRWRPVLALEP